MSMGLTVAGYDTGALSEILGYKETLIPYEDVEGLSDLIVRLVNDPHKRLMLGQINQERAFNNFSVETMISKYRELYKQYISCIES
jgi:glycosyltransferase involved in cell wall biosynthesis